MTVFEKVAFRRTCNCPPRQINCLTPREWLSAQLGVWQFKYQQNDIRDKNIHPATFPVTLAKKCISLFSHEGELILDPFSGIATTSIAAKELKRNSVGIDLNDKYTRFGRERLLQNPGNGQHRLITDNSKNAHVHIPMRSVKLIVTSPPYANLLNRKRKNKSRRGLERYNTQYNKIEQYSQNPEDLGTMPHDRFIEEFREILSNLQGILRDDGHIIINVPDYWWENKRITLHISVVEALRSVGYELRNTIIWDRTNIVNRIGIFGWPSNYITMGTTFEYLLHFMKGDRKRW